jgi:hypothetical protein
LVTASLPSRRLRELGQRLWPTPAEGPPSTASRKGRGSIIPRPLRDLTRIGAFRSTPRASAIPARSLAIADPIMALIGSIQFQDVTHQHVSQAVEFVASHSQQMSVALQALESDHHLESIRTAITGADDALRDVTTVQYTRRCNRKR